ncbi:asparagine synthase (glutamine-hydrolyzing) [Desulfonatronovibrio hydrogenovorans]|uniref:asparagine synthase (glutamine-hydrolyzing) n=1 Tax=Desulfonatronovibrio hydrogenovorans TaxID=53245 RepID=UPI00048CF184|nr:asparagine synthase (glutamine-hydrolyzing) [Desulfonatronovibrio hydrogenovorans]
MCGICGIFNVDGRPVAESSIKKMASTMVHRGPDGEGVFVKGSLGLGHRRLAIIDLDTGAQPMATRDGQLQVVFNGEIYNFLELKKDLQNRGHVFQTKSDTESILHAYREWGLDFVKHLRGMFAIALWDERKKHLVLARDRIGKKPLYYLADGNKLVFGSELKAVLAAPGVPRNLDHAALDCYFSYGYVPSPLSIFKQIRKLPPAHAAICSREGFKSWRYWKLNLEPDTDYGREEDILDQLVQLFDESVKIRMISDVPLGAFLSGGVDSSAVVASMAVQNPGFSVKTSAIGFSDKKFDELEFARKVARLYGTDHTEFIVEPDALDVIEKLVWHFDEPFADSSAIPTFYVSRMARKKVTVALSGDGGDENFAGYASRYSMTAFEDKVRRKIPSFFRKGVVQRIGRFYPRLDNFPRPLRLRSFLQNIGVSADVAYFRDMSFYFRPEDKLELFRREYLRMTEDADPAEFLGGYFREAANADQLSRAQYVDMMTYLPEDILVKVDRMSMANSLEVRAPILDHVFMEYVAGLPASLKLRNSESKYIFKKMNEGRLPPEVLYRKKQGFCVPLSDWMKNGLKQFAEDTLFSGGILNEFCEQEKLQKLWQGHQQGREDNSHQIWALLMLELWHEKFADNRF